MRADLGTFLYDDDATGSRIELQEPARGRQAGRPAANDDDVKFHGLTFCILHSFLLALPPMCGGTAILAVV